jgi:hypothetical protein
MYESNHSSYLCSVVQCPSDSLRSLYGPTNRITRKLTGLSGFSLASISKARGSPELLKINEDSCLNEQESV